MQLRGRTLAGGSQAYFSSRAALGDLQEGVGGVLALAPPASPGWGRSQHQRTFQGTGRASGQPGSSERSISWHPKTKARLEGRRKLQQ